MRNKQDLLVIVDENITTLDAFLSRVTVCFAEIPKNKQTELILRQIHDFGHEWNMRNPKLKFHLTDFTQASDIDAIVNMIAILRPTAKIFAFYVSNDNIAGKKKGILQQTVSCVLKNNYRTDNIEWAIEEADEYRDLFKTNSLNSDKFLTIVADVFCGLFARMLIDKLDPNPSEIQKLTLGQYKKLKPLVRLEFITIREKIFQLDGENVI